MLNPSPLSSYFKITGLTLLGTILLGFFFWKSLFFYNFYFGKGWQSTQEKPTGDYVILLHGIRASAGAMDNIARYLDGKGYTVINVDYPSSNYDIATLAGKYVGPTLEEVGKTVEKLNNPSRKIHIITHSMGGIVLRQYLQNHSIKNLGTIVMIAPPNHGSAWADHFGDWKIAEWIMGPALKELKTGVQGVPDSLSSPTTEFSIIAGNGGFGENDGKVSVESTKLEGMADFKVFNETHNNILMDEEVMEAVEQFIKEGEF